LDTHSKSFLEALLWSLPGLTFKFQDGGRQPMLDLATKTNTTLHPWNNKQANYDSFGKFIPEEKSEYFSTIVWDMFADAFEYSLREGKNIPETENLYDFVKAKAKERFPDDEGEQELLLQMVHVWGTYIGEPITRQSLKFAWMEQCCGGGELNRPLLIRSLTLLRI
jgi:hypothetical protein